MGRSTPTFATWTLDLRRERRSPSPTSSPHVRWLILFALCVVLCCRYKTLVGTRKTEDEKIRCFQHLGVLQWYRVVEKKNGLKVRFSAYPQPPPQCVGV